jgi:hypothetical protein
MNSFNCKVLDIKYGNQSFPIPGIPVGARFNYQRDYVIEAVWKIFMFVYYACAEQFSRHPLDFSKLYVEIEEMFNDGLLFRW